MKFLKDGKVIDSKNKNNVNKIGDDEKIMTISVVVPKISVELIVKSVRFGVMIYHAP